MNNTRRKEIEAIAARLSALADEWASIKEALEGVRDEEQEYKDNMPQSFQDGDKGQAADNAITELDSAIDALDNFSFDDIENNLSSAGE